MYTVRTGLDKADGIHADGRKVGVARKLGQSFDGVLKRINHDGEVVGVELVNHVTWKTNE